MIDEMQRLDPETEILLRSMIRTHRRLVLAACQTTNPKRLHRYQAKLRRAAMAAKR